MKKIIVVSLAICLLICGLPFSSNAEVVDSFVNEDCEVFIVYDGDRLSDTKLESIKEYVLSDNMDFSSDFVSYSILCIFGHDIKYSKAYVIDHNYYTTSPFCRETIYEVETCSRESCSYMSKTMIDQSRVSDCHG